MSIKRTKDQYWYLDGFRSITTNRVTKTLVAIFDTQEACLGGLEKYTVTCEEHHQVIGAGTMGEAKSYSSRVAEWCSECEDEIGKTNYLRSHHGIGLKS